VFKLSPSKNHRNRNLLRRFVIDWKDLEKMTVLKLRDEALKFPEIEGVHGKNKEQLVIEIASVMGIEKPHAYFTHQVTQTKSELKHKISELKSERDRLLQGGELEKLHDVRRQIHGLKHSIRKIEAKAAHG
jgi:hypothetical protein